MSVYEHLYMHVGFISPLPVSPVSPEGTISFFCVRQFVCPSFRLFACMSHFSCPHYFSFSVWGIIWILLISFKMSKNVLTDQIYSFVASGRHIVENIIYLHSNFFFYVWVRYRVWCLHVLNKQSQYVVSHNIVPYFYHYFYHL